MSSCNCNNHNSCKCCNEHTHMHNSPSASEIKAPSCSCGCHHDDRDEEEEKIHKILLVTGTAILVAAVIMQLLSLSIISKILYIISYLVLGFDTFKGLFESFKEREFFGENTLMTVSSMGAMLIGEMAEGCIVMLLFSIGEILEHRAQSKSKDNIKKLLELRPKKALKLMPDGSRMEVTPESLKVGDTVVVNAGDTIPCDGIVIEGCVNADTSSVTGESTPRVLEKLSEVRCGFISLDGKITVEVTAAYEDNTFSKIIRVIAESSEKKSKSESFITKFAKVYTPAIMAVSLAVMGIGSIVTGDINTWIYRGLVFLATSCPCAFVISVPLTFFFGIGEMTKIGLLVKGSEYVEKLSKTAICAFDKTGTLTTGKLKIVKVTPYIGSENDVLSLCAALEINSNHPIAQEIVSFCRENNIEIPTASEIREIPGKGILGKVGEVYASAGNEKMLPKGTTIDGMTNTTKVCVCTDGNLCGIIELKDEIRKESSEVIGKLKALGVKKAVMLTGDNGKSAEETAKECGIDVYYSSLAPTDKSKIIEEILSTVESTVYVGDGINDAPVLAMADVGIAIGKGGAELAVENADAVILGTSLLSLVNGIQAAKVVMSRVKFNVIFAISVKFLIMLLTLSGFASMALAVFGDVGVTLIVILNSMRKICYK